MLLLIAKTIQALVNGLIDIMIFGAMLYYFLVALFLIFGSLCKIHEFFDKRRERKEHGA